MTNDFDIMPPVEPGMEEQKPKKSFFSKLFNKKEQPVPNPEIEEKIDLPEEPKKDKKPGLKVEDIRAKLGLDDQVNTQHLYEKLEKNANKDVEKEAKEYDMFTEETTELEQKIDFTKDVPDKFNFEVPEHDFSEDISIPSKSTSFIEEIKEDVPVKPIKTSKIDKDLNIEEFNLPEDEFDSDIELKSQKEVNKDLSVYKKEMKEFGEATKDLILQKKRKHLENVFKLSNKEHLTSIESLLKLAKDNTKYHKFKDSVMKNKQSFIAWVNRVLEVQKETEDLLINELLKRVNNLQKDYTSQINKKVTQYQPIKEKKLNEFKQKENNLKNKTNYVEDYSKKLKDLNKKLKDEESKIKKEKESLKQKENELKVKYEHKEEKLKSFYEHKQKEFKTWSDHQNKLLKLKQDKLDKQKEKFEEEANKIKEELLEVKNDYIQIKKFYEKEYGKIKPSINKIHKEEKSIETEEKYLHHEEEEFENRRKQLEESLKQQESKLVEKINYNESLLATLAKEKSELQQIKSDIDQGGFSNYLKRELSNMPEDDYVDPEDLKLRHSTVLEPQMNSLNELYDMISECKSHLINGNFEKTKEIYKNLTKKYADLDVKDEEKKEIDIEIRELYDDIHLKLLEYEALSHL